MLLNIIVNHDPPKRRMREIALTIRLMDLERYLILS